MRDSKSSQRTDKIKQLNTNSIKFKHNRNNSEMSSVSSLIRGLGSKQNRAFPNINKGVRSALIIQVDEKYAKLLELRKNIKKQYDSIFEFYETNQEKLRKILMKELNTLNKYLYPKDILAFMKTPDIQPLKNLNLELFKLQLIKFSQFLTQYNSKKKIRQVEIIKQSMLSRESLIRDSSNNQQYEEIFKNMRSPLKGSGFTLYDQYKSIRSDYNLSENPNNIHEMLYNKMCDAEQCINTVMKKQAKNRQRQRMHILGLSIPEQQ